MSKRVSVKTVTYKGKKPTAADRAKAARAAAYSSNRAPMASRGFTPLAAMHRGRGILGETKSTDFPTTSSIFLLNAASGNLACLNLIQAGSSFFNRIGRKVALKNIYLNGFIASVSSPAASLAQEYLRIIVVYDAQTNGATPVWSDVVQATTQNNATSSLTLDGFNLNNRDRFKILIDKRFTMPATTAAGAPSDGGVPAPTMCEAQVQEFRKLNNIETQYKADSSPAVIGDVATGGIFILSQGTTGGQWDFNWTARVRYTDN